MTGHKMLAVDGIYDHYCYRCGNGLKAKTRRAQRRKEARAWRRDWRLNP